MVWLLISWLPESASPTSGSGDSWFALLPCTVALLSWMRPRWRELGRNKVCRWVGGWIEGSREYHGLKSQPTLNVPYRTCYCVLSRVVDGNELILLVGDVVVSCTGVESARWKWA